MDDYLTRADLDQCECHICTCPTSIKLSASCHPDDGVDVHYHQGVIILKCNSCQAFICSILVAAAEPIRSLTDN